MKILKLSVLLVFLFSIYLAGDLVANNAAFTNTPGALKRLDVYLTRSGAWTTGGYPLPEVSSRVFLGAENRLRTNIRISIGRFPGWRIEKEDPGHLLVFVEPSFWHASSRLEIFLVPVPGGLRMDAVSRSLSDRPDLGANRNNILNLFHEIGEENAIHPPV